ncbi:hypothetical protein VP1G_10793 [Cytospora mali]|uniref:Protein kinase domain-containing protein n=1 Tax=Cytospora mali TaxID=578113 RepID=A0A194UWP2_CYTMA|nr:hypothetical protein VP1G_10793 [Valsa mali var. pyri (nom. inval.)]
MSADLALAIIATVDLCMKYGKKLKLVCNTLRNADDEISERILRLENGWLRFEHQVNFARRIQHLMSQQHQEVYHKTLVMFSSKLEIVTSMLTTLINPDGSLRVKLKYVWKKESLDEAIEGLEVWQKTTDHSWFLLMRIADPGVDSALSVEKVTKHGRYGRARAVVVTLSIGDSGALISTTSTSAIRAGLRTAKPPTPPSGLTLDYRDIETMTVDGIAFLEAKMAKRTQKSEVISSYILNEIVTTQPTTCSKNYKRQVVKKDTRELARRLQHDDPETFGLLACKGFSMDPEDLKITLPKVSPKSLTQRFDIAKDLAKSVGYVHTFGFVHKNIRPESILSLGTTDGTSRSIFLVGLDNF